MDQGLQQLDGLWLTGCVQDTVYCGIDMQSMGNIRLQAGPGLPDSPNP